MTIHTRLQQALDDAGSSLDLDLSSMKHRLGELQRLSFMRRVDRACSLFEPKTSDLWPSGFAKGMREAAKFRGALSHAANATDGESMYADLVRVRTLTERMLLKFLRWPDERIWTWYDQELQWLSRVP